ncbi:MAG: hypothetical protein A2Z75_08560 [Chloroflexi bacterium RBG_13_50_10]|nr:MAG: hypothetical protein A2Z75_08560 [Chloroflexi bacterium RBG_13_50_10]
MSKRKLWLGIIILSIIAFLTAGCDGGEEVGFGIFLVDSGELVLSEQHIKVYHKNTHEIELNEEGIEKWNSYITYETIPRLAEGLFAKDFLVMVEGIEAYRGHFSSMASSTIPPGVTIVDTLFRLDSKNNTIRIEVGYPWSFRPEEDPRNNSDVFSFLEEQGLLE